MDTNEKNAFMEYMESRLMDFCDTIEIHNKNGSIRPMYDEMYQVLAEFECSIEGSIELKKAIQNKEDA